jgi:hypothetical protein
MSKAAPTRTSFLPVIIDRDLRPEILQSADPRFSDMLDYMEWASEGFPHRFAVEGNEVTTLPSSLSDSGFRLTARAPRRRWPLIELDGWFLPSR